MRRKIKQMASLFLALALLFSIVQASAIAYKTGAFELKVNPYGNAMDSIDTVSWFYRDGQYYLFLPSDCSTSSLTVFFNSQSEVTVNGIDLISGEESSAFSGGGDFTVSCDGVDYPLTVICSANVPAVFIDTESGSLDYIHADKENKECGNIRIYENGELTVNKELKHIKGRGNSTWYSEKKPYNIKFDKKTDLFNMGKAKKWTLLASYDDPSLLRTAYGWYFASLLGLEDTPEYRHVDLYINGEYLGGYIICESVEVGENRIDIDDLDKENEAANGGASLDSFPVSGTGDNGEVESGAVCGSSKWVDIASEPDDISGGYLLEFEFMFRYNNEKTGFVTDNGQCFVIKSPEYASKAEVEYISSFVKDAYNAVLSDSGYNDKGKHYTEYFDMQSMIRAYLVHELGANLDGGLSSLFMYKPKGTDKLIFTSAWDFDHAYGDNMDRYGQNNGDPSTWWTNSLYYCVSMKATVNEIPTVFNLAYRHDEFREAVREKWDSFCEEFGVAGGIEYIEKIAESMKPSAIMNAIRWDHFKSGDYSYCSSEYDRISKTGSSFLTQRETWLTKGFAEDSAMLYYDVNGGTGSIFNSKIASIGESVTVKGTQSGQSIVTPPEGNTFWGWNTKPDGSGEMYQPGDSITLSGVTTVLYAQWHNEIHHIYKATVTTEPTCTTDGLITYTCDCGHSYSEVINATGHHYGEPVFNWNGCTCMASMVCDCGNTREESCTVTSEVTKAATTSSPGVRTYTATIIVDGRTYTDTRTEIIPQEDDCGSIQAFISRCLELLKNLLRSLIRWLGYYPRFCVNTEFGAK